MADPFTSPADWLKEQTRPIYKSHRAQLIEENPALFRFFNGKLPEFDTHRKKLSHTNMQTSESHPDLHAMEKLSVGGNRTNASTPVARHKPTESTLSRSAMMTPPENDMPKTSSSVRGIYISSTDDDDVFSGDVQPRPSTAPNTRPITAPSTGREVVEHNSTHAKQAPRGDRLNEPVTPNNAQGVLPPEALVFVANLAMDRTDEQLEQSCHDAFDQYGECHVKVRRDRHKHPFALIQYYVGDADAAIKGGRDLIVDGRKIRTEHAQARREYIAQNGDTSSSFSTGSVVLSRVGGGAITRDEAEDLLGRYGPIEHMQPTTHQDKRLHGVPEGMWVKFAYYLDFKDAVKGFNNTTSLYKLTEPPNLEPRTRPVAGSAPIVQGLRTPRSTTDQKSVFVGNLPADTEEAELLEIFAQYGEIKGCNIIRKPITGGQGFNIFGFIEFDNVGQADHAAEAEVDIRGQRIRVEPKEYSARRHTRLQPYGQSPDQERQPRAIAWGPSGGSYQSPHGMPGGFYPVYAQSTLGGFSPFHQGMYGYAATPPNSGGRRGGQPECLIHGSPHPAAQYFPVGYGPAGMQAIRDIEQDDLPIQHQRYR